MILYRVTTFPGIFYMLLILWSLQIFAGNAFAQSLLSDFAWLEQNIEVKDETETETSAKIGPTGQKTPLLPSDLLSAPATLI